MRSLSYQRKIGYQFFPELLVLWSFQYVAAETENVATMDNEAMAQLLLISNTEATSPSCRVGDTTLTHTLPLHWHLESGMKSVHSGFLKWDCFLNNSTAFRLNTISALQRFLWTFHFLLSRCRIAWSVTRTRMQRQSGPSQSREPQRLPVTKSYCREVSASNSCDYGPSCYAFSLFPYENLTHKWYSARVRCFATACWFHSYDLFQISQFICNL
jgi:hypothetical protein